MSNGDYTGPADELGPGLHRLATGVWLTSGRTVVVEGAEGFALVDPGDERWMDEDQPVGPLAEILSLTQQTGKPVTQVWITHAHPDHVTNLSLLRQVAERNPALSGFSLLAHEASPAEPDIAINTPGTLECFPATVLPTPGHSPWGDDLAFYLPTAKLLLSGDLVQPKGEAWDQPFYPSPYPYFTDGETYLSSLDRLLTLDFAILVTGHREVRFAPRARQWVELTRRAITEVRDRVAGWTGSPELDKAAREIFITLCRERGLAEATIALRMADATGGSSFQKFDLPGISDFWYRLRGENLPL